MVLFAGTEIRRSGRMPVTWYHTGRLLNTVVKLKKGPRPGFHTTGAAETAMVANYLEARISAKTVWPFWELIQTMAASFSLFLV